jgi:hypothetical protein
MTMIIDQAGMKCLYHTQKVKCTRKLTGLVKMHADFAWTPLGASFNQTYTAENNHVLDLAIL